MATRRTPITGVSEFPDLAEKPVERAPAPGRRRTGAHGGLPVYRPAAPFEAYRDRSDAVLAATGARPTAFLATLGPLAAYSTRAVVRPQPAGRGRDRRGRGGPHRDGRRGRGRLGAGEACRSRCSVPATRSTPNAGRPTAAALRAAGARRILVAGRVDVPGIDGQLYAGCDALAVIDGVYVAGGSA